MAKPSLYEQVDAVQVSAKDLKDSPRHWNPGLLRFRNRLWMCYRYHLMKEDGRCATAICEIDHETLQPARESIRLMLSGPSGNEHHEDARLFIFNGEPYISYTEMTGYIAGVDYRCTMKYAKLKLTGLKWSVVETWQPRYGNNSGKSKEKNWTFFEWEKRLFCIYQDNPERIVLEIQGDKVVAEYKSAPPVWHWGNIRGGCPPIQLKEGAGSFFTIFHSSLPSEKPPHWVRYVAGAYSFEAKPPFAVTGIMEKPFMSGSEADGHGYDPRYAEGWKPFVVFPCGAVEANGKLLVSLGVNDWRCAIAKVDPAKLELVAPDGTGFKTRYFTTSNGSRPVRIVTARNQSRYFNWIVPSAGPAGMPGIGYISTTEPLTADAIEDAGNAVEITQSEYSKATGC